MESMTSNKGLIFIIYRELSKLTIWLKVGKYLKNSQGKHKDRMGLRHKLMPSTLSYKEDTYSTSA